ncbi:DUF3068 domain-containing protein [Microbispora triticiradicis]|uniref:DUF3068 domain-containing protein n=1 Tax=Microbispora triticiradicis TaxID=2200763 RepID=A0ABX9LMX9_9ACTN|nr:DUF3068 domain-containing protein [Microbispora triticiradicis]RGA05365.1 DUF3068 domain-containing protein [Microbispora triticiradicis]
MRRTGGLVLLALGVFFVVLAPLLRFWAADRLVHAPADQDSTTELSAPNARYFSVADMKVLTGNLAITVTTRGDTAESAGDHVVWDQFTNVNDVTNERRGISFSLFRSAFNKYDGTGVNCCQVNVDKTPVRLQGQIFLFPFGVEKKTYPVYNPAAKQAFPAEFAGEEVLDGLRVYRFVQKIPPTVTDTLKVPATVLGMKGKGDKQAERVYDGTTTFWVEPETGLPVKQEQRRHEVLKTGDGVERTPALVGTATYTPETVGSLVRTARDNMNQIALLKTTIPLVSLIVGLAFLLVGGWLMRPERPERFEYSEQPA